MKSFLLLFILLFITSANAHITDPAEYIEFVKNNGFWAMAKNTDKVMFCFGIADTGKPICSKIPDRYIVIRLPDQIQ